MQVRVLYDEVQRVYANFNSSFSFNATNITTTWTTTSTMSFNQPWSWIGTGASTTSVTWDAPQITIRPPDPEEQRRRQEEVARTVVEERHAASRRAYALLDLLLDEEQQRSRRENQYVDLDSPAGNRYRLLVGVRQGNVRTWDPILERWSGTICVHAPTNVPDGDNLAAQILAIQTDEARFLRLANMHDGYWPNGIAVTRGGSSRYALEHAGERNYPQAA